MRDLQRLPGEARALRAALDDAFPGIYEEHPTLPAMCVAEEVGEFIGAVRRMLGLARRSGTRQEAAAELADVVISSFVAAEVYGFNLQEAISDKMDIIFSRGFKEAV